MYYSESDRPFGLSLGQWTVRWWEWMLSEPLPTNPAADETGQHAAVNQQDPNVWFLAGTLGHEGVKRNANIPAGKSIFFPVINVEINSVERPELHTDKELVKWVVDDQNDIVSKNVVVDGNTIPIYRVKSDPEIFPVTFPDNNAMGIPPGDVQKVAADGYWVFLRPLAPGQHHIYFKARCEAGTRNIEADYNLTIS